MKNTIYIFLSLFIVISKPDKVLANHYSSDITSTQKNEIYFNIEPFTIIIVGTVIIIKKALASKAFTIGLGYAKKLYSTYDTYRTIEDVYKLIQSQAELSRLNRLMEMTDNELYTYCHQLGGGMASTMDARQNQWGDKYIFGVIKPIAEYHYAGAICVSA